ncbi:peptidoglycan editing factor PgeF [Nakamurella sp. GG22]
MTTRSGDEAGGGVSMPPYDSFNLGGGVGDDPAAVTANRERLAAAAGLPADRIVWMRQVHGATVTTVTLRHGRPGPDPLPDTDGIVTADRGVGLAVLVADCVPILAADPVAGVIAAVHAGRRGAADGIAVRAVQQMITLGAAPERIDVLLGPAICGACYEVPRDMRDEVDAALPGSACVTERGTPGLDLRAGLAAQLRENGVAAVVVDPRCTATDQDLFSHRRGAPTGRLAGLIWMPDPAAPSVQRTA